MYQGMMACYQFVQNESLLLENQKPVGNNCESPTGFGTT